MSMENVSPPTNSTVVDEVVVKQGFDAYLYIAYVCILVSYVNINILVFRFWLILSAIFFVVWSCVPERAVQLDSMLYNVAYIIINVVQSIPLVKAIWPVKLNRLEQEIFDKDEKFRNHMSVKQYKYFMAKFKTERYAGHKSQLIAAGSSFNGLIYIAKISPGWKVNLAHQSDNDIEVVTLQEGSWIGSLEYIYYSNLNANVVKKKVDDGYPDDQQVFWGISAFIEDTNYDARVSSYENVLIGREGVIIYKIDLDNLRKLFVDDRWPMFFKNAFQAVLLDYTTDYIVQQDINLINYYKQKQKEIQENKDDNNNLN